MRWTIPLIMVLFSGCATAPGPAITESRILHYLRSNRDGSEPEHVVQFLRDDRHIAVYKWVEKCTTAAYVTADFDPEAGEAVSLDAGKVAPDGSQTKFGRLERDSDGRAIALWIDTPAGRKSENLEGVGRPWFLFDYDLADLNAALQTAPPQGDFAFYWTLVMPDPETGRMLQGLGWVDARDAGIVSRDGRRVRRFALSLRADRRVRGDLWTDPARGYIVAADFDRPNHDNYRDFALELERVEHGGVDAWNALTANHYAGCGRDDMSTD